MMKYIEQNRSILTDTEDKLVSLVGRDKGWGARYIRRSKDTGFSVYNKYAARIYYTAAGTEPIFYNNFKWNMIYKNTESLCCTPETNIMLLAPNVN